QALRERIGADRHRIWFEKKSSFALHDDAVIVGVANRHFQEWLTKQYRDPIQALATELLDRPVEVRFQIDSGLCEAARAAQEATKAPPPSAKPNVQPGLFDQVEPRESPRARTPKRRWRHLNQFVIGPCNRVAFAAALSVVE